MLIPLLSNLGFGGGTAAGDPPVGRSVFLAPVERRRALSLIALGSPLLLTVPAAPSATDVLRRPTFAQPSARPLSAQTLYVNRLPLEAVVASPQPQPGAPQTSLPSLRGIGIDTSRGSTAYLPAVAAPFVTPPFAQVDYPGQIADTTYSKLVRAAAVQDPVFPEVGLTLDARALLQLSATTSPSLLLTALLPDLYAATILTESFNPTRPGPQPLSTAMGMPAALRTVVAQAAPFLNPPQSRVDRPYAAGTFSIEALPPVDPNLPAGKRALELRQDRRQLAGGTSRGSNIQTPPVVVLSPAINLPFTQVGWNRWLADTSHGTPKTLTQDSVAPFFVPPSFLAHPKPPVWDTTHQTNLPLASFVPPPIPNMPPYIVVYFWKRVA